MDLLNFRSHFNDGARLAAGSFMSPLTNAISEQRRLVENVAVVSKVRVEECKHMMTWSKYQTEDLGDVLLKLNLLIRKISDYEIRFGTQYESFREKIKYLRTKDDTLCEMGRRQADLQTKLVEASKSRLRSAKAMLLQKELDAIQKESEPTESKFQHLKRQLIKDAYTIQLDAVVELGKKMQIIGEHGKQLLEHIDVTCSDATYNDGRETEAILQAARIALEQWDKFVAADPKPPIIIHSTPTVSLSDASIDPPTAEAEVASENVAPVVIPLSPSMKGAPSVAVTKDAPPLPPRTPDRPRLSGTSKRTEVKTGDDMPESSEEETLRRLEELEIKQALELSMSSSEPIKGKYIDDLGLSAEELRFVMDEASPQKSTSVVKKQQRSVAEDDSESERDIVAAKVTSVPKIVRGPQTIESGGNVVSQQGPRPWVPEEEQEPAKEVKEKEPVIVAEELASSSSHSGMMGEQPAETSKSSSAIHVMESLGREPERPLESMGTELERPLESMGNEPEPALESMGHEGHHDATPFVPMPQVPSLDGIRDQKILTNQQRLQQQLQDQQQPGSPFPLSPELQYLQVNSPQISNQASPQSSPTAVHLSPSVSTAHPSPAVSNYQSPTPYKPTTTYVPHPSRQSNRLSGSHTPPFRDGANSPAAQLQQHYQQQQQQQQQQHHQQQRQQQYPNQQYQTYQQQYQTQYQRQQYQQHQHYTNQQPVYNTQQHQQQQKQLHDFYYTPSEQEYQQQDPGSIHQQRSTWNWSYPVQNSEYYDQQYKVDHHRGPTMDSQYSNTLSSPSSHISPIPADNTASSTIPSAVGKEHIYKV